MKRTPKNRPSAVSGKPDRMDGWMDALYLEEIKHNSGHLVPLVQEYPSDL